MSVLNVIKFLLMMSTKRKVLTVIEKVAIIKDSESGVKNIAICKKYGLSSSTVSTLLKNKKPLLHAYERNLITSKRLKKCTKADLDEVLFKWYIFQRNAGLPTNCNTMKNEAEKFAFQLGYDNFSCTSGWLQRFRIRHNILSTKRNGETTLGTVAKPPMCSQTGLDSKEEHEKASSLKKKSVGDSSFERQSINEPCEETILPKNCFSFDKNDNMLERVKEPLIIGPSLSKFENSQNEDSTIQNSMLDANRENIQLLSPSSESDTIVSPSSVCEAESFDGREKPEKLNQEISEVVVNCLPINLNLLESISTATDCVEKLEYFFKSLKQKDSEALNAINVVRQKLIDIVHANEDKLIM